MINMLLLHRKLAKKKKKKEYGLLNKIAVTEIVEKNANFYYRALNVNKLLPVNR